MTAQSPAHRNLRSAVVAEVIGLVLTIACIVALYVDHANGDVLADHIRDGYPTYSVERIDHAATLYLVYLTTLYVLGIGAWVAAIFLTAARRRVARWVVPLLFLIGTSIAVLDLLVKDTSGSTGIAPLHGWLGVLPCVPGCVAAIATFASQRRLTH